jgi:hypothetical protein
VARSERYKPFPSFALLFLVSHKQNGVDRRRDEPYCTEVLQRPYWRVDDVRRPAGPAGLDRKTRFEEFLRLWHGRNECSGAGKDAGGCS